VPPGKFSIITFIYSTTASLHILSDLVFLTFQLLNTIYNKPLLILINLGAIGHPDQAIIRINEATDTLKRKKSQNK
jgi:hypothetical protein